MTTTPPPTVSPATPISDGGDIKLSHRTPEEDEEVTITVRPDRGYELDRIAVYDRNGDRLDLDRTDDDSYTFIQPRGRVTIQVTFVEIVEKPDLPFRDVDVDDWFYDAVVYAYENGLMSGTGETTFSPSGTTTRGQIVTILWRLAGSPQVNYLMDFSDVDPAAWYDEAVRWASSLRIASGYGDGRFGPDDPITREQLAVMLYQYAWNMGYDLTGGGMALREYGNYDRISGWALEALDWAVNAGIISGTGDSALSPQGRATCAQTAVMLMRLSQLDW